MKQTCFVALLAFCALAVQAQQVEVAPLGAEWHYQYHTSWTGLQGFYNPQCIQDTMLSGKSCKRLKIRIVTNGGLQSTFRYIHQSGDSIFQYMLGGAGQYEFFFLFRNNFQLGETTRMGGGLSPWNYQVTAIDTLIFNNQVVRRFVLQGDNTPGTTSIYDRFGPERGFFGNWCGIPCDYNNFNLRCYQAPNFPQVNISDEPCEQIGPVSTQEVIVGGILLFPNPAQGGIRLVLPENSSAATHLHIMDLAGRTVLAQSWPTGATENDVNVTTLPVGAYLIVVQSQQVIYREKFVKN